MRLSHRFTLRSFLEESERFADHLGLAPRPLSRLMHSVRTPDLSICQAMFGRSFFAVPWNHSARRRLFQELARKKVRALEVRSPPVGAWCRRVSRPERQAF
jgi:pantoate kinase